MQNIINLQRRGYLTEQQVLQAHKFSVNPQSYELAPTFYRILHDAIIKQEPLESMEKRRGWPARSAKAIIGTILHAIQETGGVIATEAPEDIQALREELEYVKADNSLELMPLVSTFGFTTTEAQIFLILQRSPGMQVGKEAIHNRLYSARPDDAPEIKIVDVLVCKLRKKLEGTSWSIETIWGVGYKLVGTENVLPPPSQKERAKAADNENKIEKSQRNVYWYKLHVYDGKPMREIAREYSVAPSTVMRVIHGLMDAIGDEELDNLVQQIPAGYSEANRRLTA